MQVSKYFSKCVINSSRHLVRRQMLHRAGRLGVAV